MCYVRNSEIDHHYNQCLTFKYTPIIELPKEAKSFQFTAIQPLQMAPFVCYYDKRKLCRNARVKA